MKLQRLLSLTRQALDKYNLIEDGDRIAVGVSGGKDSLALLYADVLHELAQLRGEDFSQLHIVGGGCQNTLLNQLCADACGIRVIAGPVEASTLGNIGIQLMTLDELNNVDDFRQVVSTTANLTTFTPNPDSEIAHYVAQIHSTRQTKELCA